jgi:hypothetical protein
MKSYCAGFTFSSKYCDQLNLPVLPALETLLTKIKPQTVRICAYWDQIEPEPGNFDFSMLDKQIDIVEKSGVELVVAIGRKVPRWPEFHEPQWVLSKDKQFLTENLNKYLTRIVEKYQRVNTLKLWQVENEPLVDFGYGRFPVSFTDLETETDLVRSIDDHDILLTDSGERSNWQEIAKLADVVGINIYTAVYDSFRRRYLYHNYSPGFYTAKAEKINKPMLVAELQAEPWGAAEITSLTAAEVAKSISPERLQDNIGLALNAGFTEIWYWGVEWWLWLAKQGNDSYFELVKD